MITAGNTKDIKIMRPLKNSSGLWRTLEIPLINCEVSLVLTWSKGCVITKSTGKIKTDAKLYFPLVTLSARDNARLLQQLKSCFKRTVN